VRIKNLHLGDLKEGNWEIFKDSDIKNLLKA
jgi:16S rRNA U516 pseudouridylate synthase RsuA-like enzyme